MVRSSTSHHMHDIKNSISDEYLPLVNEPGCTRAQIFDRHRHRAQTLLPEKIKHSHIQIGIVLKTSISQQHLLQIIEVLRGKLTPEGRSEEPERLLHASNIKHFQLSAVICSNSSICKIKIYIYIYTQEKDDYDKTVKQVLAEADHSGL